MNDLQKKFDEIIREVITPIMKKEGFEKQGRNFYKDLGVYGLCLNLQSNRYNDAEEVSFTINTSIVVPQEYFDFRGEKISDFPKEYEGIIRKRAYEILGEKKERWYEITSKTDIQALCRLLSIQFEDHIVVYFRKYYEIAAVLEELSKIPIAKRSQEAVIAAGFIARHGDFNTGKTLLLDIIKHIDREQFEYFYEKTLNYCMKLGITIDSD